MASRRPRCSLRRATSARNLSNITKVQNIAIFILSLGVVIAIYRRASSRSEAQGGSNCQVSFRTSIVKLCAWPERNSCRGRTGNHLKINRLWSGQVNGEKAVGLGAVLPCLFLSMVIPVKFSQARHMFDPVRCISVPNSMDGWLHWWSPSLDTQSLQAIQMMSSHPRCSHPEEAAEAKYLRSSKEEDLAKKCFCSYLYPASTMRSSFQANDAFYSKTSTLRAFSSLPMIASLITGTLSQNCWVCSLLIFSLGSILTNTAWRSGSSLGYPQRIHCIPKHATLQTWQQPIFP